MSTTTTSTCPMCDGNGTVVIQHKTSNVAQTCIWCDGSRECTPERAADFERFVTEHGIPKRHFNPDQQG